MTDTDSSTTDAVQDALKVNYNRTGVAVMQAMYSDEYLSLGGTDSTDVLARRAGISSDTQVLDIGCGVGGPALHLAASIGCHVTGIDLVDSSIDIATTKAKARGLDTRTHFEVADATSLPFADNQFDVVFGQDAWCHIPNKQALIAECARVLRPGGIIAFTDWLRLDDNLDAGMMEVLEAALSKDAASREEYLAVLEGNSFVHIETDDLSERFAQAYQDIYARLRARRHELIEQFNERIFEIVAEMNRKILKGFEDRRIGGALFIGRKAA